MSVQSVHHTCSGVDASSNNWVLMGFFLISDSSSPGLTPNADHTMWSCQLLSEMYGVGHFSGQKVRAKMFKEIKAGTYRQIKLFIW